MDSEKSTEAEEAGGCLMDDYLIFDDHFHLNYGGNFIEGALRFKKAGGNAINLTNLPDYSLSPDHY